MINSDTSVKVAVRIRPLNSQELAEDSTHCIDVNPVAAQVKFMFRFFFFVLSTICSFSTHSAIFYRLSLVQIRYLPSITSLESIVHKAIYMTNASWIW